MSLNRTALVAFVAGIAAGAGLLRMQDTAAAEPVAQGVYELRTYTTEPGRLPDLEARFRNHTIKLFEKHGMTNVLYWNPTDPEKARNTLVYLLWHKSEEAAKASFDAFRADPEWIKVREESEKNGKINSKVESMFLKTTDFSPKTH